MHIIHVVGLGVDHGDFAPVILRRINAAEVLVGGDRLLSLLPDHAGVKIPIRSPLDEVMAKIDAQLKLNRRVGGGGGRRSGILRDWKTIGGCFR